jgi:hypothetical protein
MEISAFSKKKNEKYGLIHKPVQKARPIGRLN